MPVAELPPLPEPHGFNEEGHPTPLPSAEPVFLTGEALVPARLPSTPQVTGEVLGPARLPSTPQVTGEALGPARLPSTPQLTTG